MRSLGVPVGRRNVRSRARMLGQEESTISCQASWDLVLFFGKYREAGPALLMGDARAGFRVGRGNASEMAPGATEIAQNELGAPSASGDAPSFRSADRRAGSQLTSAQATTEPSQHQSAPVPASSLSTQRAS